MIKRAAYQDLASILSIYEVARTYMRQNGNPDQWGDAYPPLNMVEADLRKEQLYICKEGDVIHGVFALVFGEDPAYAVIEQGDWLNEEPYGTIHRVAADGRMKGMFHQCAGFCKKQIMNLRIDTHCDNKTMQHVIEKEGFIKCGIIHMEDGSPRIAYQYIG